MNHISRWLRVAAGVAMAVQASVATAQIAADITPPPVPPEIEVPAGNTVWLKGHATGTQNYICLPSSSGFSWKFVAPQATLFLNFRLLNNQISQQITTHFLSANPDENGTPRPTWQGSLDTSAVWGKAIGTSSNPNFVASGAIPWLLLQVVGREDGPTGGNSLTQTTYIQRLTTKGGIAPATGCSEASTVGALALVPYTADYYFFKASGKR